MALSVELRDGLRALACAARQGADLAEVFRGFDQDLPRFEELIDASEPRRSQELEVCLEAIARRVHGPRTKLSLLTPMSRVREARFWHGALAAGGYMGLFFYFEEHDVGIVAFARGEHTEYVRFRPLRRVAARTTSRRGSA